jgi:hypothetical protein
MTSSSNYARKRRSKTEIGEESEEDQNSKLALTRSIFLFKSDFCNF